MECDVSCQCGNVKGVAKLSITPRFNARLNYEVTGPFQIEKDLILCPACNQHVFTKGHWR